MVKETDTLSFSMTTTSSKVTTQKVWKNGALVSHQTDTMRALPLYAYGTTECFTGNGGDCGSIKSYSTSPSRHIFFHLRHPSFSQSMLGKFGLLNFSLCLQLGQTSQSRWPRRILPLARLSTTAEPPAASLLPMVARRGPDRSLSAAIHSKSPTTTSGTFEGMFRVWLPAIQGLVESYNGGTPPPFSIRLA